MQTLYIYIYSVTVSYLVFLLIYQQVKVEEIMSELKTEAYG